MKSRVSSLPIDLINVIHRLRIAGLSFVGVLSFGCIGFYIIGAGEASVLDSFYMTAITITTIGFHEVIDLSTHPWGRLFTIILAFMGFGVMTYFVSNIVALFIEGDFRKTFQRTKMEKLIYDMEQHYIICGCGRVGENVALELERTERPFVAVDTDESRLEDLADEYNALTYLAGDATDEDFLEKIGAKKAKGVFITTGDDNTNLVICLTARQINPKLRLVVRSKDINHAKKMIRAGADRVVTPNYIGGIRMAAEMLRPKATSFMDEMLRAPRGPRMEELIVPQDYTNRPLKDVFTDELSDTILVALHEGIDWIYKPDPNHILQEGSSIILITSPKERKELKNKLFPQ